VIRTDIRFLEKWDERFMLAVPWLCGIAALCLWHGSEVGPWWEKQHELLALACALLLFDGVHVVFTFALIATLPELRTWARSDRPSRGFWSVLLLKGLVLLPILYLARFTSYYEKVPAVLSAYIFIDAFVLPTQHTLAQMRGISFCFHSAIRKAGAVDDRDLKSAVRIETREKTLFRALFWLDVLISAIVVVVTGGFLGDGALPFTLTYLRPVLGVAYLITIGALLVNGSRYPGQARTGKMAFLTRLFLYPLRLYIGPMMMMTRVCHGTEYLVIFRQLARNSKASGPLRARLYWVTAAVSILYAVLFALVWTNVVKGVTGWEVPAGLYSIVLMATVLVRYLHYDMDRVLFQMKNPRTRAAVAPMLMSSKRETAAISEPRAA
jgi:hypothetical protein